jgi:predicted TIM-barrel fold metal-dependent hydrolase
VDFHIAGTPDTNLVRSWHWETFGPEAAMAFGSCLLYLSNARTIVNFIYSGLLDKYPQLKLVSVESGMGWLPFLLKAMEYQLDEQMPTEGSLLQRRPREYFRDHFYATFWFEDHDPATIDVIGPNNVMIETDFPHATCLFPHHDHIASVAAKYSPEVRKRILQDNAAELYRVSLPTTTAV